MRPVRTILAGDEAAIPNVTRILDACKLAVVPTDTLYALAADALQEEAVQLVFEVKRRPADQAVPVCVASMTHVGDVASITPLARKVASAFWPGAVTLVLSRKPWLPDAVTGGGETVAVRVPDHPFALALARAFGPFVVTSANKTGEPPPNDIKTAREMLGDAASLYVDAGPLANVPSTVVDCTGSDLKVIRHGLVSAAMVERAVYGS